MTIKGLTDRGEGFNPVGFIRLGLPKLRGVNGANGRSETLQHGEDLGSLFRIELATPELETLFRSQYELPFSAADNAFIEMRKNLKNEQARNKHLPTDGIYSVAIPILFPFSARERNFDAWFEVYDARNVCLHRCDGVHVQTSRDKATLKPQIVRGVAVSDIKDADGNFLARAGQENIPCPIGNRIDRKLGHVMRGRMTMLVPGLGKLANLRLTTGSSKAIGYLSDRMAALEDTYHTTQYVPLVLFRRLESFYVSNEVYSGTVSKWLVDLDVVDDFARRTLGRISDRVLEQINNGGESPPKMLPSSPLGEADAEIDDEEPEMEPIA